MSLRDFLAENFAGDLEYHPKRGLLYLCVGAATACVFILAPTEEQFTTGPLVFLLGGLGLVLKGIFLFRKSSEGLGLTMQELGELSDPSKRKPLPAISVQASQILQDFGTGPLLLAVGLNSLRNFNNEWTNPPSFRVFLFGGTIFIVGLAIKRGLSKSQES